MRKFKNSSHEEIMEMFSQEDIFPVASMPINLSYLATIDKSFDNVRQFENIVAVLETAKQGDTIKINLATDGGALHAILPLLAAMQNTEAEVAVHAISDVASAGTLILLAADYAIVNPYAIIMFHQVQFGIGGVGSSVEANVIHTMKNSKALLRDIYQDFFTAEEIEQMLMGRDFYMDDHEFDERYENRHNIREELLNKRLKEMAEEQEADLPKLKKPAKDAPPPPPCPEPRQIVEGSHVAIKKKVKK